MNVVYRNVRTGRVVERAIPDPLMEQADRWQRVDQGEDTSPPDALEDDGFDPSRLPVSEVNAALACMDTQARGRALNTERAGRARRGILAGPYGDEAP